MKSGVLVKITACFLAAFVGHNILLGATGNISMFTGGSLHALFMLFWGLLFLLLVSLFLIHFVFIFLSSQRAVHFTMVVLVLMTFVIVIPLSSKWGHYMHEQWFLQKALPEYQAAVEKILQHRAEFKDRYPVDLRYLVNLPAACSWISGETNSDGSVMIHFAGGDHWREGYYYYSGTQITPKPSFPNYYYLNGNTNYSFFQLTDGWYE